MMFISCFLYLLFTCALLQVLYSLAKGRKTGSAGRLPPGPFRFPIIGNLLELGDKPHKSLAKLAETHGPLMSLKLGNITTVVISSATVAKEILQKHDLSFANRTILDAVRAHQHDEFGMPWLPVSTTWRNLRKMSNSNIFTTQKLDANQNVRHKKVHELLSDVHESCRLGAAVDIGKVAFVASLNFLSNTFFSADLATSSSDSALHFKELVRGIMEEVGKPNLADFFPVFRRIDPQGIRRRATVYMGKVFEIFDGMIDQRLQLRKAHGYITGNDMLDTLLNIIEQDSEMLDRTYLKHLLLDLFAAGTDTTSSTLEWAMAELLQNTKILSKAKAELEQIIGKGNPVMESDIPQLPYLQAVVKETFRLHPAVPLLLPRKAATDVELCGFTVPQGAQVLVNAWAIGRDPTLWKDKPDSFKPERFLGSDVDVKGGDFELIPFGAGRRICPGLPLATRMLHLMLGSLIHSFDWKLEGGVAGEDMDMDDKFGISLRKAQPLQAVPIAIK